jgi:hypothetical protein
MKNYIGISRDHSGSMSHLRRPAAADYNANIEVIKENALSSGQDTIVSVAECGVNDGNYRAVSRIVVTNSSVQALQPMSTADYHADGRATPLFDSVGQLIELFESVPDYNDPEVSFLVMAITDGEHNQDGAWNAAKLSAKIKQLQATDRWSFVFRVPRGYAQRLSRMLGIPMGNILEWEQSERGVEAASQSTRAAFNSYYQSRSAGSTSTTKFFTDLSSVSTDDLAEAAIDVSGQITLWTVNSGEQDTGIRELVEARLGGNQKMKKGAAFYQLTKTESNVQSYKQIIVRDKNTGIIYAGGTRGLLGLPNNQNIRLAPGNHDHYDIFIQSTSVNRKCPAGSTVLYWPNVGVPFKNS